MGNTPTPRLTVLLPTFNNQSIIRDCLESFRWADEILVVDSYSSDQTPEICREYGARIIQHEYIQSAMQKNWAIPQCTHEWVLQVDTDERPEAGLREEICAVLNSATDGRTNTVGYAGYRMPMKHHVLGEWVRVANLYPEYHLRLFRRDVGRFEDKQVHARVIVPGPVGTLQHHLLHYGMPTIGRQLSNLDRYARYQADELSKRGKRFHWYHLALRPLAIFSYYFLWKRGFAAGYRGLLVAAVNTTFDFWAHAKLWEMQTLGLSSSPK